MSSLNQRAVKTISVETDTLQLGTTVVTSIAADIDGAPTDALVTAGAIQNLVNDIDASMRNYVTHQLQQVGDIALENITWVLAGKPIDGGSLADPPV